MSKSFKNNLFIGLVVVFVVPLIVLSVVAVAHFQSVEAQTVQYDLSGWLYSDTYGWISLNSANCRLPDCTPGAPYKVVLESNNVITGYGWSSNVGWVCFGSTCTGIPPSGPLSALLDPVTGQMTGWAQIISLGADGWIHFRGGNVSAPSTVPNGVACYGCEKKCNIWTQACDTGGQNCHNVDPCLKYFDNEFKSCSLCFSRTKYDLVNIPNDGIDAVAGGSGYIGGSVSAGGTTCNTNCATVPNTTRVTCDTCSNWVQYGASGDSTTGSIYGWGWNGFGGTPGNGAGWVHFNTAGGAGIVYPWLETQYGAIYGQNKVQQKAGTGRVTYCIYAQDIKRMTSTNCANPDVLKDVKIDFLVKDATKEVYKNAIGKIDITGLVTVVSNNGIIKLNKYRQEIQELTFSSSLVASLNNKVYVTPGPLTINSVVTIKNGRSASEAGNGTIIVNGDLIINANINYGSTADINAISNDLKRLASVAWIVRGDVIIGGNVTNIAGAFMVLGKPDVACQYESGAPCDATTDYPKYLSTHYGIFFSGASVNPLTVWGLVVAKAFDFRRAYANLAQGSERIIYDGRLSANPPPGLSGFTEGLPIIRDFSY